MMILSHATGQTFVSRVIYKVLHLDTHAFVWLFEKKTAKFSSRALQAIEDNELRISPAVYLETEYLYEIGRLKLNAGLIYSYLHESINLDFCGQPFARVVRAATEETFTRDPFDRIITAQARLLNVPLLSGDANIAENYCNAMI